MTEASGAGAVITGDWIKSRRKAKKWSQRLLADAVRVAQGTVSSWESGRGR